MKHQDKIYVEKDHICYGLCVYPAILLTQPADHRQKTTFLVSGPEENIIGISSGKMLWGTYLSEPIMQIYNCTVPNTQCVISNTKNHMVVVGSGKMMRCLSNSSRTFTKPGPFHLPAAAAHRAVRCRLAADQLVLAYMIFVAANIFMWSNFDPHESLSRS